MVVLRLDLGEVVAIIILILMLSVFIGDYLICDLKDKFKEWREKHEDSRR